MNRILLPLLVFLALSPAAFGQEWIGVAAMPTSLQERLGIDEMPVEDQFAIDAFFYDHYARQYEGQRFAVEHETVLQVCGGDNFQEIYEIEGPLIELSDGSEWFAEDEPYWSYGDRIYMQFSMIGDYGFYHLINIDARDSAPVEPR